MWAINGLVHCVLPAHAYIKDRYDKQTGVITRPVSLAAEWQYSASQSWQVVLSGQTNQHQTPAHTSCLTACQNSSPTGQGELGLVMGHEHDKGPGQRPNTHTYTWQYPAQNLRSTQYVERPVH